MKSRTSLLLLGVTGLLAACGSVGGLEPPEGRALPSKPYGAKEKPAAAELIVPGVQTRPGRSDELLRRSERREDDPFDLPPGSEVTKTPDENAEPVSTPPE